MDNRSPRVEFQWKYFDNTKPAPDGETPTILNIGCADDPIKLGDGAFHFDIDDWSYMHKWFKQGDAHALPFEDKSFMCVILGDILEHVLDPLVVTQEAARVTAIGGDLVLSIFEEWRLPGPGQWIKESHEIADKENIKLGYEDREHYQRENYPDRIGVPDDDETPHLSHINQFTDGDINNLVNWLLLPAEFILLEATKVREENHEGHDWFNWLIAFRRIK